MLFDQLIFGCKCNAICKLLGSRFNEMTQIINNIFKNCTQIAKKSVFVRLRFFVSLRLKWQNGDFTGREIINGQNDPLFEGIYQFR